MIYFKACPRCHRGDVHFETDNLKVELSCIQCGWHRDADARVLTPRCPATGRDNDWRVEERVVRRSTVQELRQRGWRDSQIAAAVGASQRTVQRDLSVQAPGA